MLRMEEIKDYLSIDFDDPATDRMLERMALTADAYLQGSLGSDYPSSDDRAKQIALIVIGDLYDNRGGSDKVSGATKKLVSDFSVQLRCELLRRKENG